VGTTHVIWVNPTNPKVAEVEVGWNPETLMVPLFGFVMCLGLLFAARYYWALSKDVDSELPPGELQS
jgi:hypothetical protein